MKIGLVTRRAGFNFGSSLQALAMYTILKKIDPNVVVIDIEEYRLRGKLRLALIDLCYFITNCLPIISSLKISRRFRDSWVSRKKFEQFEKNNLTITKNKYKTLVDLQQDFKDYDFLVCGSDQIWSPIHLSPFMFLNFANHARTVTIAYAPSIGVQSIAKNKDIVASLVKKIDYVSIREARGADLIGELLGRNIPVVLDPTLLLSNSYWSGLIQPLDIKEKYILCYFLDTDILPFSFIENLRIQTGYKIINLHSNYSTLRIENSESIADLGPLDFLSYINQAAYICTNSFHGSIFSIHLKKNLFVFNRFTNDSELNQNSRIETLLSSLGLEDRLKSNNSEIDLTNIDYSDAYMALERLKHHSFSYLNNAFRYKK